ncbi:SubName: Full=Uncharacterized protein {ECO:0000313/EMBL:CCA72109.1} [Serendipita indica DSM 11827]|nr:SubName: Full=Uncharacterized protein {ECO:0000313/EMBL:CCA72109.1} [Serendipita indica DSM 11827]
MHPRLVKRLRHTQSPFETLLKHRDLCPFVRRIAIHAFPRQEGWPSSVIYEQLETLFPHLRNLRAFAFTVPDPSSSIDLLLPSLASSTSLKELSIMGQRINLKSAELLLGAGHGAVPSLDQGLGLEKLNIKTLSPGLHRVLLRWIERNKATLQSLSIRHSLSFSDSTLQSILNIVPRLAELKLLHCGNVDHWRVFDALEQAERLKSLALTILDYSSPPPAVVQLSSVTRLWLRFNAALSEGAPQNITPSVCGGLRRRLLELLPIITGILERFRTCQLETLTLESAGACPLPAKVVENVRDADFKTLRKLSFAGFTPSNEQLERICEGCPNLEVLRADLSIDWSRSWASVASAISKAKRLHTFLSSLALQSTESASNTIQGRFAIAEAKILFDAVPSLQRIVNANRCWLRGINDSDNPRYEMVRQRNASLVLPTV